MSIGGIVGAGTTIYVLHRSYKYLGGQMKKKKKYKRKKKKK